MAEGVMMRQAVIRQTPIEITNRLSDLGLSTEVLAHARIDGQGWRNTCTLFDPPSLPGILGWGRTLRALREQLAADGWTASAENQISSVVSPAGVQLLVLTGDEGTGNPASERVSTKYSKGAGTLAAIVRTQQISLFPQEELPPHDLWILLLRVTLAELRAELSRPLTTDAKGYI